MTREVVLFGMGSNLSAPDRTPRQTVVGALEMLSEALGAELRVSGFYRTPAFPAGSGPDFVNVAAGLESDLPPEAVLEICHEVEAAYGRTRAQRWEARVLDIDLLAHGHAILPDRGVQRKWMDLPLETQKRDAPGTLILPHPRLHERAFVLRPLADIAPDWVHPVLGRSVAEMLAAVPAAELAEIRLI